MAARLRDFLKAQFSPFLVVLGWCVCVCLIKVVVIYSIAFLLR